MEPSIWSDLRQWFRAIIHHWVATLGCALVAAFQVSYGIWSRDWPPALSWALLVICFLAATFLAWRDEHRKTIGKDNRLILNEAVDLLKQTVGSGSATGFRSEKVYDPIGALIELSDRFGNEQGVEFVCQQLEEHDYGDPFGILSLMFEPPSFDGKRLKFLRDARLAEPPIKSVSDALHYIHSVWADKNGLIRKDLTL